MILKAWTAGSSCAKLNLDNLIWSERKSSTTADSMRFSGKRRYSQVRRSTFISLATTLLSSHLPLPSYKVFIQLNCKPCSLHFLWVNIAILPWPSIPPKFQIPACNFNHYLSTSVRSNLNAQYTMAIMVWAYTQRFSLEGQKSWSDNKVWYTQILFDADTKTTSSTLTLLTL